MHALFLYYSQSRIQFFRVYKLWQYGKVVWFPLAKNEALLINSLGVGRVVCHRVYSIFHTSYLLAFEQYFFLFFVAYTHTQTHTSTCFIYIYIF